MNDMSKLFDEVEAELLKQFKAITPEQLAEEERRRQVQCDWEAQHTAIETEQEEDDEQEGD